MATQPIETNAAFSAENAALFEVPPALNQEGFFDGSRLNDSAIYEALFADHPNFRSVHEDGVHFSGADAEVVDEVVRNASAALSLIQGGIRGAELADSLSKPVLVAA